MEEKQKAILDEEWVELILQAKNLGFSKEEVLDYLRKTGSLQKSHEKVM